MADAAPAKAAPKAAPKAKKASKPKKPAAHPKYSEMIAKAVADLKERGGSSRQAILKYIMKNFNVGKEEKAVNSRLKLALRSGVKKGGLKQSKGEFLLLIHLLWSHLTEIWSVDLNGLIWRETGVAVILIILMQLSCKDHVDQSA